MRDPKNVPEDHSNLFFYPTKTYVLIIFWCGARDSNPHVLTDTATSRLRVYQFRQLRIKTQFCEHPLRGLPAYPTSSLCGVAHKKLLLAYAPSTRYCEAAVCGRWRSRLFPHQTAPPHRVITAYAAAQFFARALPSL
jgi:hypothetical protein